MRCVHGGMAGSGHCRTGEDNTIPDKHTMFLHDGAVRIAIRYNKAQTRAKTENATMNTFLW